LVLSRPAWLDGPMPYEVQALFGRIAHLLREFGADGRDDTLRRLELDPAYAAIEQNFPDTAQSLRGQIIEPRAVAALARLERLPRDRPIAHLRQAAAIRVPTLVLAHGQDPVHPLQFGLAVARTIRDAWFVRLTPKSVDRQRHTAEVQRALTDFMERFRHAAAPLGRVA
jgi:pimeloyl-ACP methyl ester carboxylesterase